MYLIKTNNIRHIEFMSIIIIIIIIKNKYYNFLQFILGRNKQFAFYSKFFAFYSNRSNLRCHVAVKTVHLTLILQLI